MHDSHAIPGTDVVVAGVRLHVVTHGRGDGLPVLLLHGLATSSYLWCDVMRDLEHQHRTIAPDLLGLGHSERPRQSGAGYDLAAQAALLLRLLDVLAHRRVVVVGHGLGGAVAVHLAALGPERVAGLVLTGSPVHADAWPVPGVLPLLPPLLGECYLGLLRRAPRLAQQVLATTGWGVQPGWPYGETRLEHHLGPLLTADGARGLLRFVRAVDLVAVESSWRLLAAAPPPALVLWGEDDRSLSTAYGRRLVAELTGAAWVPVVDAGHLLPHDRPERVAEELAAFVAQLPAPQVA